MGDFKEYFGTELPFGDKHRVVNAFKGLGTVVIDGEKRRIHSFRLTKNEVDKTIVSYKENDESGEWKSHHSGVADLALRVFLNG